MLSLHEIVANDDLAAVKTYIENHQVDINKLDPHTGLSVLTVAMKNSNFQIFHYLITQGADINAGSIPPVDWIAYVQNDNEKKFFIFYFLKKDPNLQLSSIKRKSLEIVLGLSTLEQLQLSDKKEITELGCYLFYFGAEETAIKFFKKYQNFFDFTYFSEYGLTILNHLAMIEPGFFADHLDLLTYENLNASSKQGKFRGITVLYSLAFEMPGRRILQNNPKFLTEGNLDAGPDQGEEKGTTVLLYLAAHSTGMEILQNNPDLLIGVNLNAGCTEGPDKGITVLYCLAASPIGRRILLDNPKLLLGNNLKTGPIEEENSKNVLDHLLSDGLWREKLISDIEWMQNFLFQATQEQLIEMLNDIQEHRLYQPHEGNDYFNIASAIQLALAFKLSVEINPFLKDYSESSNSEILTDIKKAINDIFELTKNVSTQSKLYQKARNSLGEFLLQQILAHSNNKDLQNFILNQLEHHFGKIHASSSNLTINSIIKLYAISFYTNADNTAMLLHLIAELMHDQKTLPNEQLIKEADSIENHSIGKKNYSDDHHHLEQLLNDPIWWGKLVNDIEWVQDFASQVPEELLKEALNTIQKNPLYSHNFLNDNFNSVLNLQLALATKLSLKINLGLKSYLAVPNSEVLNDLKGNIHGIFELLKDIPKQSKFYEKGANVLAETLLQLAENNNTENLQNFVVAQLEKIFGKINVLYQDLPVSSSIKLYIIAIYINTGNNTKVLQLTDEYLPTNTNVNSRNSLLTSAAVNPSWAYSVWNQPDEISNEQSQPTSESQSFQSK